MDVRTLLAPGIAGAAVLACATTCGPALAADGLVIRPGTAHGALLPGRTATSTFAVAAPGARVALDSARVTRVRIRPAAGRQCPPGSVHAVVQDVRHTRIGLRPAVLTVRLRLTPAATAGCAGAGFVPQVAVTGTDAAGHPVSGTTPSPGRPADRIGAVVAPVRGEALLDALPVRRRHGVGVVLVVLAAGAAVLALDPARLVRAVRRGGRR